MSISGITSKSTAPATNEPPIATAKAAGVVGPSPFSAVLTTHNGAAAQESVPAQGASGVPPTGLTVAGKFYTTQQIQDFYASGGDDYVFAQANGLRDQNFIYNLALQARAIGGGPTGDAAVKLMFKQYQASTPNGASATNFDSWKAGQSQVLLDKVRNGTYVGRAIDCKDFEPGGIFAGQNACYRQNGLDANGSSDKWIPNVGFKESAPAFSGKTDQNGVSFGIAPRST